MIDGIETMGGATTLVGAAATSIIAVKLLTERPVAQSHGSALLIASSTVLVGPLIWALMRGSYDVLWSFGCILAILAGGVGLSVSRWLIVRAGRL